MRISIDQPATFKKRRVTSSFGLRRASKPSCRRGQPSLSVRRMPAGLRRTLSDGWPRLHEGFEALRRPKLLVTLLFLNVAGWSIEILMYWAYGRAFGLSLPAGAYVSIAVVVSLVTTIPVT